MTASLLVIALVVGLFAGFGWARATRAVTDLRKAREGVGKAKTSTREAWTALWVAFRLAAITASIALLYFLATATGATTSTGR